jgi:hypothetical protein
MEKEIVSPFSPPENEPRTPIQRVVGARLSEEARQRILQEQAETFHYHERPEWNQHEITKTQEQLDLLELANDATDDLLRQFGREPFHISPDNYHLLDETGRKQVKLGWESGGAYSIEDQAVFMRPETDPVIFSLIAFHETLHFKSYQALQRLYPGKEMLPYRRGFEIVSRHGHRSHFRHIDEAVIQEFSNRFVEESLYNYAGTRESVEASERRRSLILAHRDKLSKEEVAFLEELVPYVAELPEKAAAVFSQADPPADQLKRAFTDCKHRNLLIHPYADNVHGLHTLVNEIYERNKGRFREQGRDIQAFRRSSRNRQRHSSWPTD